MTIFYFYLFDDLGVLDQILAFSDGTVMSLVLQHVKIQYFKFDLQEQILKLATLL